MYITRACFRGKDHVAFTIQKFKSLPKSGKINQNFKIPYFFTKFDGKFLKVNQVPNNYTKYEGSSLTIFETSCTQDFQILYSKGHNSEKGA